MLLGLHSACIMHTNMASDIRVAKEAGYDTLELWIPKIERYLAAGFPLEQLIPAFGHLRPSMINCLLPIETEEPKARAEMLDRCERMSAVAQKIGCPTLQGVALDNFSGDSWPQVREQMVRTLREVADIAASYNVKLGLEVVTFSKFHLLSQALEVLDLAGRSNIGLILDTWHLWTGGTSWEEVAATDLKFIISAHISDTKPKKGVQWHDMDRAVLPGDGILPLIEGIQAIQATGFDGIWSVEMFSDEHWEWEPALLALELKRRTESLLAKAMQPSKALSSAR